jgi:Serine carboxypeptidase
VLYNGDADYNCNIFGNIAVADEVDHKGYSTAGWQKMQTSDNVRHGEVRQSGRFALARIYESGHEVPFYQPLAALELFERALNRKDIATGKQAISASFKTAGSTTSTYREGNGTVQYEVVPTDATYNTTTNKPNPYKSQSQSKAAKKEDSAHGRSSSHRRPRQAARAMRPTLPERRSLHGQNQRPFRVKRH